MPYYKATLKNGIAKWNNSFKYKLGLNIDPNADKRDGVCVAGIHLSKRVTVAREYLGSSEGDIYEAESGVILGEDSEKIRVAYCWLTRLLSKDEWLTAEERKAKELAKAEAERLAFKTLWGVNPPSLPGIQWLNEHGKDISWEDWNKQTLEVSSDRDKITVYAKIKPKDIKTALAVVRERR